MNKDVRLLAEAYEKVLKSKQQLNEGGMYVEIGYGGKPLPDTINLNIDGQEYIVSGEIDISYDTNYEDAEYSNIQGYGTVQTYGGGSFSGDTPSDIEILTMYIQIPEVVKREYRGADGKMHSTEEEKYVYEIQKGVVKINELQNKPQVIKAAREALINKGEELYNQQPELFDEN
jgi:hypothetical protein